MEKSNKRGKIPQTDWPLIMTRYEAGETLSSIARTYDCSPPAISYIISRNREQSADQAKASPAAEPQLVKAHAVGPGEAADSAPQPVPALAETRHAPMEADRLTAPSPVAPSPMTPSSAAPSPVAPSPVAPSPVAPGNGEARGRLHLGLRNGATASGSPVANGNGSGNGHAPGGHAAEPNGRMPSGFAAASPQPRSEPPFQPAPHNALQAEPPRNGGDFGGGEKTAQQPRAGARHDSDTYIGKELRSRVDGDIAAFLAAFDAALAEDSPTSRFGLREATDRLLRAGARTRIELERLEARVPLPPRDAGAQPADAWRHR